MRKNNILNVLVLAISFMLTFSVMTGTVFANDAVGISKEAYDAFGTKYDNNNTITPISEGVTLVSNAKAGWSIEVEDGIYGEITVAYKISNEYFMQNVKFRDDVRSFWIADGSGPKGINHVKLSEFIRAYKVDFMNIGGVELLATQYVNEGELIDWDQAPLIEVPEGKIMLGWAEVGVDELFDEGTEIYKNYTLEPLLIDVPPAEEGWIEIDEDEFKAFGDRYTANNNTELILEDGAVKLVFIAQDGWYIEAEEDVCVTINVAIKISNRYLKATIVLEGPVSHRLGDGRGANGINAVSIGDIVF